MSKFKFPKIVVDFTVHELTGKVVHTGYYTLTDDKERAAFNHRAAHAMRDGFEIRQTRRVHKDNNGVIVTPGSFLGHPYFEYYVWMEALKMSSISNGEHEYEVFLEKEDYTKVPKLSPYRSVVVGYNPDTQTPEFNFIKGEEE